MTTLLYQVQLVMYIARLQVHEKASCEHCGNPCVLQHWATEDKDMPDPHGGLEGIEEMPYWQMCLGAREIQRYPPPPPHLLVCNTQKVLAPDENPLSLMTLISTQIKVVSLTAWLLFLNHHKARDGLLMDCAGPPRYLTSPVSHRHIPNGKTDKLSEWSKGSFIYL